MESKSIQFLNDMTKKVIMSSREIYTDFLTRNRTFFIAIFIIKLNSERKKFIQKW